MKTDKPIRYYVKVNAGQWHNLSCEQALLQLRKLIDAGCVFVEGGLEEETVAQ